MRPLTKERALQLIRDGHIVVGNVTNYEDVFLDSLRIGLRLRSQLIEILNPVDLNALDQVKWNRLPLSETTLIPNHFYLAISREEFSLPFNVMGMLNTRSKFARFGLDLAKSSVYVTPGFGNGKPAPFVFEISSPIEIRGLSTDVPYGFMTLFELDFESENGSDRYDNRFPFNLIE